MRHMLLPCDCGGVRYEGEPCRCCAIYHEGCGFAGLASVELADGSWTPNLCSYCDREEIARLRALPEPVENP